MLMIFVSKLDKVARFKKISKINQKDVKGKLPKICS